MMTSSCGLKMAVTFDGMIFLIWGRPFSESVFTYLWVLEKKKFCLKNAEVSSHVTYGRGSFSKKVQNMLVNICTKIHASFTIWSIFLLTSSRSSGLFGFFKTFN